MFSSLPLVWILGLSAGAAGIILVCGVRLAGVADRLADRTGLGEALVGAVVLGAATSLPGAVVSLTAALEGQASLAFSNAVGGIAAQTAFLAIADMLYRRANLEHAAAELANVYQGCLLMLMLTLPVIAFTGPHLAIFGVHPASILLLLVYVGGVIGTQRVQANPMWHPEKTRETSLDAPDEPARHDRHLARLVAVFVALVVLMGAAGWVVAQIASELISRFSLSQTLVGTLMTAIVTSLPELVTTLAAVRRGALQLAVGGIIGGNTFDTLFITLSDIGYRDGSLYHALSVEDLFWLSAGLMMTCILTLGLIARERFGPGRIGLEGAAILLIYLAAAAVQVVSR